MLHVFPSFGYGGQQARFAALAGGLGSGFQHHIISLDDDLSARALVPADADVSFESFVANKSPWASIVNLRRFEKIFKAAAPDILCTYNWGAIEAALANRMGPRLPHIHFEDGFGPDEAPDRQPFRRILARRFLLSGAEIVVPSHVLEETALKTWKIRPFRLHYISNGVDFDRFQQPQSALRSTVVVGSVGALRPEKNYLLLIRAFARADRAGKASLKIAGEGLEREALARAVADAKARGRISLPGATAAPEELYKDFDIFALSSDTEQAPLTVMEAMAAGLPVVATNVGDIVEMVSSENRAFIVPLGDEDAYVLALAHLIQNPDARAALGAANRKKAKAQFDLAAMLEQHRALYLSVLSRKYNQSA